MQQQSLEQFLESYGISEIENNGADQHLPKLSFVYKIYAVIMRKIIVQNKSTKVPVDALYSKVAERGIGKMGKPDRGRFKPNKEMDNRQNI